MGSVRVATHLWPVTLVWGAFCVSRVAAWFAGVRFDASPLPIYWQYIDPALLKHHLLQSVWYLHAQPPLYNLLLGIGLKLFGSQFDNAAFDVQLCLGLTLAVGIYAALVIAGVGRWFAAAAATLFTISPTAILFENWLFYEYLVATLLVLSVVAFGLFVRRRSALRASAVFGLLAAVCYLRASFQVALLVLVLALMLALFWNHGRAVLLGAAIPIALVVGLMVKNWVMFGTPATSSWMGMNLMQVAQPAIYGDEKNSLQRRHVITGVSTIPTFSPVDKYAGVVPADRRYAHIPVLAEKIKSTGATNYNNINYVDISNQYLHDFFGVVAHDPGVYLHGVRIGLQESAYPSPDYAFFLANRAKMEWWVRDYDAVVLGQPHERVADGVPVGTAWGLIAYYVLALGFGAVETVRLLRRRGGSPIVAFVWLLLAYATTVLTLAEIEENQRVRFVGDPLAMVLVCVLVVRVAPHVRPALAAGLSRPAIESPVASRAGGARREGAITRVYLACAAAAVGAFAALGTLLATTLPYHDYDSFAFGEWSRGIAEAGKVDPITQGALTSSRPLFYELQGALWSLTGIDFTAGRLLSLAFALLLLGGVAALARALNFSWLATALSVIAMASIPAFAGNALSGESDVPAAAMVAVAAALAIHSPRRRGGWLAIALSGALAVLAKQTTLIPLIPLALVLATRLRAMPWDRRLRSSSVALAAGLALGFAYDAVMAVRFHLGVLAYLRTGSGGFWAQLAAQTRGDAILRADVLGEALRVPLLFCLVYAILRVAGQRHRFSACIGLAAALAWATIGPLAASVHHGPFDSSNAGYTFVGFGALMAALVVPRKWWIDRWTASLLLAMALPPLIVWVAASTYATRLAATAWPALALLIGLCLAAAVETVVTRVSLAAAFAPLTVLAVAVWMSLAAFDGFNAALWHQYRALGWHDLRNSDRTLNVVLPGFQEALAAARPELGAGRLASQDPRFAFFMPGRVDTFQPLHCGDVRGDRIFVLLTSDESEQSARQQGGLAMPQDWARCSAPKLHQLTDGQSGYAVFSVS